MGAVLCKSNGGATEAAKREREDSLSADAFLDSLSDAPSDAQKLRVVEHWKPQRWTPEQDDVLRMAIAKHGPRNWKLIAAEVEGRNHGQCQQRWNKVLKPGLVKGHWSVDEDALLKHMALQGCHSWTDVAAKIPGRTPQQCQDRWRKHLDPSISRASFTPEEDSVILEAYERLGHRWTKIADLLPGRTDDAVKSRWKTLNPYRKANTGPGRPRRMPHVENTNLLASLDSAEKASLYNALASMLLSRTPAESPTGYDADDVSADCRSDLSEPIVEPSHGELNRIDSKDAAILWELLRSHSSSLMSFGSARDLSSFADVPPEELLNSGELDELFKAVSLTQDTDKSLSAGTSSTTSAPTLIQTLEILSTSDDQHIFQELIDAVRASSKDVVKSGDDTASHRSQDFFSTASTRDLLHSLEFGQSFDDDDEEDDDEDEEEEEDDDDLLRPIHFGKRSTPTAAAEEEVEQEEEDEFSDLLKPIHRSKRASFIAPESSGSA